MTSAVDCLIVGGGPAGLTAAIYAARFRLSVTVIDSGASRAALIPCSRNHAGFPEGVTGVDLLSRMCTQALKFDAGLQSGTATALSLDKNGRFIAVGDFPSISARAVILATGVTNRRPPMDNALHDAALASGRLRYCPVCDAYEVTDQKVAIIGTGAHGVREATFLRAFTSKVSLIASEGAHRIDPAHRTSLDRLGISCIDGPARNFVLASRGIEMEHAGGRERFDTLYPALGSVIHSGLAKGLCADLTDEGCIRVDAHQRTSVARLYAAGDVVIGLDQISHAMGEAGVAATTLRNDLAAYEALLR